MYATHNCVSSNTVDQGPARQRQGRSIQRSGPVGRQNVPVQNLQHSAELRSISHPDPVFSTLEVTHLRISYSSNAASMGIDGSGSASDMRAAAEPTHLYHPTPFQKPLRTNRRPVARRAPERTNQKRSSESSLAYQRGSQPSRRGTAGHMSGKSRLPWLDGSRSRQGSVPTVPGAFHDEPQSAGVSSSVQVSRGAPEQAQTANLGALVTSFVPRDPQNSSNQSPIASVNASGGAEFPNQYPLSTSQGAENTAGSNGVQNSSSTQDTSKIATPAPLIAMARELYRTDSSGFSESETSMKGGRKRALDDAMTPATLKPTLVVETAPVQATLSNAEEQPSPKADVGPERPTIQPASNSSPFNPPDRTPSITVQPLRSKKVTMTVDDLPQDQVNRNHSISLQPIKTRTASRTLNENATGSQDLKSISGSPSGQPPATQNLRQSIAGLENLMQEAMQLAKDAADQDKSNEIPAILDEARFALHRASIVQGQQETAMIARHGYSDSSMASPCSSCSDLDSSQSRVIPQRPTNGKGRNLDNKSACSDRLSGPKAIWDEDWPHHRLEPRSVDWAYARQDLPTSTRVSQGANRGTKAEQSSPTSLPTEEQCRKSTQQQPSSINQNSHLSREAVEINARQDNQLPNLPQTSIFNRSREGGLEGASSPEPPPRPLPTPAVPTGDQSPTNLAYGRTPTQGQGVENWGRDKFDEKDYVKTSDTLKGKHHVTLKEGEHFSIHHGHVRQPIARNWSTSRKRFTAITACVNTALIGVLIGIYAGEVPAIQYRLADTMHHIILGNVFLYLGMAITTFLFWPLPLLHGRKPYTLMALGIALPLQIPQAIIVSEKRSAETNYSGFVVGLLLSRGFLGLALGFAHINFKSTLLDLYGASLQSEFPHGETVIVDDVRRHGGGMGYWLGIWSFSFIGSLALGFLIGADVISGVNISWGFYICVILLAAALFLNVVTPETRRSPHRRTMQEVELPNDSISRRVARGEIKMHVSGDGPKWWWEEVFAGVYLSCRMLVQSGFFVMALYLAWIYAQIVLIIVLLGNLLSAEYSWRPEYVGVGVLSVAVGALLAVPNSKANFFSRSRIHGPRTDSMTFQPRFTWTSHCVRRALFMVTLPIAGLAYTLASKGSTVQYMIPIVFAALIGYVSNLAIAECNGIIMENFDTSDLQPGTNSRHRLQSLAPATKRRRTTYSSYPRVSAGFFVSQSLGFLFAAAATGIGGAVTRTVGAQKSTAITAGILFGLTILLICVLFRFRVVQVIPNELFGSYFGSAGAARKKSIASIDSDKSWRAVVIGNPSGKFRRMNWLELGSLSRWTEIRRLNRLLSRSTTQALNPGWR